MFSRTESHMYSILICISSNFWCTSLVEKQSIYCQGNCESCIQTLATFSIEEIVQFLFLIILYSLVLFTVFNLNFWQFYQDFGGSWQNVDEKIPKSQVRWIQAADVALPHCSYFLPISECFRPNSLYGAAPIGLRLLTFLSQHFGYLIFWSGTGSHRGNLMMVV